MLSIPDGAEIARTYRVEARLGSGAFGTVYRVRHRFLGRLALKVIGYNTEAELGHIAREGAVHSRLAHPNVTRVYDVNIGEVSGDRFMYIACEYMSMGTLSSYLGPGGRLGHQDWSRLVLHILNALAYVHDLEPPVLHRDITLGNILVGGSSKQPVFKLGDFGVSAELRRERRVVDAAGGTLLFLPPESGFGSYLKESDLYSAALVLYKALTGTFPFPLPKVGADPAAYQAKQDPEPPSRFLLGCSPDLDAVMLKALAPQPFDRYRSAGELKSALTAANE